MLVMVQLFLMLLLAGNLGYVIQTCGLVSLELSELLQYRLYFYQLKIEILKGKLYEHM